MTFEQYNRPWTEDEKKWLTTSAVTAISRMLSDWKAEREKLIEVLEWIKLQPQKCQKIMREHNWKYEDSEDFNQKMIFTMYSHVVGCAAKSEYILIEVKEKGG